MKRLHSFWTYPFVFSFPCFDFFATYSILTTSDFSFRVFFIVALINFIFLAVIIILIKEYKRVYLKDTSLYVYDLYSNTPYILPLEQLRYVERDNSRVTVLWGVYKVSFLIEDGEYHTVKFMKNKLIFNLRKYI
jgi:hypothetical protein